MSNDITKAIVKITYNDKKEVLQSRGLVLLYLCLIQKGMQY